MNLTPEQRRGIEVLDRSLLISAAAGSGKTAVLAQRCAHIVCWSENAGREACGVENLLVVTFTNAAAQEMRQRIAARLAEELAKAEAPGGDSVRAAPLRREITLLPRAHISTLSSFCANLVRRHFNAAGVDPNFAVLDEDQARLLKQQSARAVLDEQYESDHPAFIELIDLYADGYDPRLMERLIACHDLQMSMVNPPRWREESLARAREAAEAPVAQSELGRRLLDLLAREMAGLLDWARQLRREAEHFGLGGYVEHISECMIAPAMEWLALAESRDLEGLIAAHTAFDRGRLPNTPNLEGKAEVQRRINRWKWFVREGPLSTLLRFTEEDWQKSMRRVLSPMEQFLRLTELFEAHYEKEKARLRALDFADLERLALRLLLREPDRPEQSGPSDIALYYQRQFHHVLVDEFQDINQVQDALLRLLSRESAPEEMRAAWQNNLFAVGDVKQSIYRFRLAEPEMFKTRATYARENHGNGWERIDLQMNFRSRAPLLEAVNWVFSRLLTDEQALEIDYTDAHELHHNPEYAAVPEPGGFPGRPVELHVLEPPGAGAAAEDEEAGEEADEDEEPSAGEMMEDQREADRIEREATLIATRIEDFLGEGRRIVDSNGSAVPLSYRHIAVLLRSRKFNSERFANVLRKKGVPCFSEIGTGFFASLEVRDILSLLAVLDNRRQDIPLAAVLRSPLVDLPEAEDVLARVRLAYPWKDVPFFEAAFRYAREKDDAIAARLRYVLDKLARWRGLAQRRPIAELLWQIYEETGYLAYVAGLHDGEQRTANLLELHSRAGQFDAFARQGLRAFMEFLRSLEETGEVGQPPTLSEADDVVRVMSIHAAKGLEFPVVFLADCGKAHNLMDSVGSILLDRAFGLAMQAVDRERQVRYPSLVHELAKRHIRRASLAEELRVLYVAMTRAREHLVCVGTAFKSAEQDVARWYRDAAEPISSAEVLRARSYLEWLGRAAAGRQGLFDINVITAAQIDAHAARYSGRAVRPPAPQELANLEPLSPPPAVGETAQAAIDRLTARYLFADVARLQAAAGVTSLEPGPSDASEPEPVDQLEPWRIAQGLRPPAFLAPAKDPGRG